LSVILPSLALLSSVIIVKIIIWLLKFLFLLNLFNWCFKLYYIDWDIFLTYYLPNSFNGKALASCPCLWQMVQIVYRSLHSFVKWPSLWHFWQNTLH
jgi:hypothetical protein